MKKINKLLFVLVGIFALTWTGCTESVDYVPANAVDGNGVFFSNTLATTVSLVKAEATFKVEILREKSVGNATVNLIASDPSGKFTIPSSISFSDGAKSAFLTIGYNSANMTYDEYLSISLSIANASDSTPYGNSSFTFKAGVPSPWKSLGMTSYTDNLISVTYGAKPVTYSVEVQENEEVPGLYRLVNPYGAAFPYNEPGDWDSSKNYYLEINATNPAEVYMTSQNTGLNWGNGNFYFYSFAAYYKDRGNATEAAKYYGKLTNNVITFPAGAILRGFLEQASNLYVMTGQLIVVLPKK